MNETSVCNVPHWAEACEALSRADPVLAGLIQVAGKSVLQPRNDAFYSLSRSIVAQQISVHAAEAVWQRLTAAVGSMTPSAVCGHSEKALHACGLSRRKASYLLNLAEHFRDGALAGKSWHRMDDEQVIETLVEIKGIGRWTAEMFLIFHLLRPDVLPVTDIGIQKADASAVRGQGNGEVRGNRALSHPALAGRNGDHVLNPLGLAGIRHGRARRGTPGWWAGVLRHPGCR